MQQRVEKPVLVTVDKLPKGISSTGQAAINQQLIRCLIHDDLNFRRGSRDKSSPSFAFLGSKLVATAKQKEINAELQPNFDGISAIRNDFKIQYVAILPSD